MFFLLLIPGKFVDNLLEGRVLIEFTNGSVTVGHAHRNRLVGMVRKFKNTNKFVSMENVITGEWSG